MTNIRVLVALILFIAPLAACDTLRGFERVAPLSGALDLSCVETTVRSLDGISEVKFTPNFVRYWIAGTAGQPDAIWAAFYIIENRTGSKLVHAFMRLNQPPPLADMEVARPVMLKVEKALASSCPFAADLTLYRETCKAPKCPEGA